MRKGLVFFSEFATPAFRRRRTAFVVVLVIATCALIWPGYLPFASARPLLLGLPLSMVWVVFWLVIIFVVILWLYRRDASEESPPDGISRG